ncbi:MAG: DUF3145 domain-containing protein [Acidothermus cellulolyticus]|jgi:hypothetical protein|nr:DUF3145 domain-containing protein [Acidothermus cellulolyticus]MBX5448158.1 DUF3145 domain-containing protein [Acidothermus cellulolyticus]
MSSHVALAAAPAPRPLGKASLVEIAEVLVATCGVLYIHSATPAVVPHVEWATAGVIGMSVHFDWQGQPAAPGHLRAEVAWSGPAGTAGRLASTLRGWPIRFEVTEDPSPGADGERYAFTPSLGLYHALTSANGDLVVPENRLRMLLATGGDISAALDLLLGGPWDAELEAFRHAGEGAPVRWLHRVG